MAVSDLIELEPHGKLLLSVAVIVAFALLRLLALRIIRRKREILSERQRRTISAVKNITWFSTILLLSYLWFPEIRNFAFSIAAVTVALVIATKELILCFSGSLLKASSGAFSIGDWIEVGDIRGEVIEFNVFATTLQELSAENRYDFTGKSVVLPNSAFLTTHIKNLNFMKRYVFHSFAVTTSLPFRVEEMSKLILKRLAHYSGHFIEVAHRYNSFIESHSGIDLPCPDAQVSFSTTKEGRRMISVSLFCPTHEAMDIEQKTIADIFNFLDERRGHHRMEGEVLS